MKFQLLLLSCLLLRAASVVIYPRSQHEGGRTQFMESPAEMALAVRSDLLEGMTRIEMIVTRVLRGHGAEGEYSRCSSRTKKPSLTILSLVAGLPEDYVTALRENRAFEADAYGYEYCEYNHSLDDSRDVAWSKVVAIRELLRQGKSKLVWMDADAYFTTRKPFESITGSYFQEGKDIVFTDDIMSNSEVNSGVVVMRNTEWSQDFWKHIWEDYPEALNHPYWEQKAIDLHLERHAEVRPHIQIIPHETMNSVGSYWGPFVAHIAGGHGQGLAKYQALLPKLKHANDQMGVDEPDQRFPDLR